jgi:hypothetical protein
MTRKDVQLIADVLANTELSRFGVSQDRAAQAAERQHLTYVFATALEATNDRFDRVKFLDAATPKEGYR